MNRLSTTLQNLSHRISSRNKGVHMERSVIALALVIIGYAPLWAQTKTALLDRALRGDDTALVEMEKSGDIKDLRLLLHEPNYGAKSTVRLFLAKMGDQETLQYFACRALTTSLLNVREVVEKDLNHIGGEFTVQVYRRWLDSDAESRPKAQELMKSEDSTPLIPSAWALIKLPSLVPSADLPKPTGAQIQPIPMGGSEELKAKWRDWIDSHEQELQKLEPTAGATNFDAAVCLERRSQSH